MNSPDHLTPWLAPLGWLALEAAVVVLAALALQPLLRTAAARRSLWRAALLAMLAMLALELTGTGSQLPAQLRLAWQTTFPQPAPPPEPPALIIPAGPEPLPIPNLLSPIPSEPLPEPLQFEPTASLQPPPLSLSHSPTFSPAPSPLPAFLWLTGLAALLARAAWTHAGFAWLRLRHFLPAAEALRERVQTLAARLGLRRHVRVLASARLHAPAAFGWVRPGVGVPGDFTARYAPAQQDVMLAHELAHLAARDPLWQLLADLAVAALWWHPLAWVARHQHRLAAELAADDASQALPDGPVLLAECLLALGQEAAAAPRAPLGMAGFRSQLGRRVERLVALPRRDWSAPGPLRLALQTAVALAALAALALLPGCAANRTASEAPPRLLAHWWQAKKSPVGDDVRSLHSNAETSQRLVTSSPTNTQPVILQGRVSFQGTPLPEREIPLPPRVLAARANAPLMTRFHRISTNGGLADVLVYVKTGLPNEPFPAPTNPHPIRIQGYEYQPYITAVQVGQPIRWESDMNLNLHPTPTNPANREFNFALMPSLPVEATFTAPEFFLRTKDDVHPWLFGYVSILPHPYFAVTDADGRFRFPRPLPPGKYTLAAVHRRAGEVVQELDLTVPQPAGQPMELDFALGRPTTASQSPPPQSPLLQTPTPRPATATSPPTDFTPSKPPTRAELLDRKAHVESQLKEAQKTLSPTHPKQVGLRKQLETIEEALKQTPPVGDDVRSLQSPQPQTPSQRLVTSSPTAEAEGRARLSQRAEAVEEIHRLQDLFVAVQRELSTAQRTGTAGDVERLTKEAAALDTRYKATVAELARLDAESKYMSATATALRLVRHEPTVNPGDSLQLIVAEDDAYSGIYPVRTDGTITVKKVGRVPVGGRRLGDAQAAVKTLLEATQLRTATVTLTFVGERATASGVSGSTNDHRVIYLAGEFITPGPMKIPEGVQPTLIATIMRSGGIMPNGDLSRTKLLRIEKGQGAVEEVNVAALLSAATPPADKPLKPGDIILVPAFLPAVHVTGGVGKPGRLRLIEDEKLTAYAAILRAGGFAPGVSLTNCYVVREVGNGGKAQLLFNVKQIQRDPTKDIGLQAGDIVVVPSSRPPPSGDDVRSLQSNPERGTVKAEPSQRLVTSSPTGEAEGRARLSQRAAAVPPADGALGQTRPTNAATSVPDPLLVAEEEALRRQQRRVVLDKMLAEAKQFQKAKSWTHAAGRYEEAFGHARLLGMEAVKKQFQDALAGLTHCRLQLAVELQEKYEFKAAAAEADKVLPFEPKSSVVAEFKKFNELVEAAHKARLVTPGAAAPVALRAKVMSLVRDGRLHLEVGQNQEARKRLEEAIALDPVNDAAYFYLRLVQESQFELECKVREKDFSERIVEVAKKWNDTTRVTNGLPSPNPSQLTHSSKGAQIINRKLDQIVLPEVHFDAVPLVGVVQRLMEDAKQFDPEPDPRKKGLNFLINDVAPAAPLLDAAGNPVPVARPVALSEGLVRVTQPLKNLTLRQALDVICKTAELPTQFSVEEYAIVFIPRGPVAYYSRIFRVNPDTFIQGLQGVVGQSVPAASPVGQASSPAGAAPARAAVPATAAAAQRTAAEANALVRQFFQSAGVTALGATNGSTRVTFNPANGLLQVRGTTNDLRLIEQAIQKVQPPLVSSPPSGPESRAPERDRPGRSSPASTNAPGTTLSGSTFYRTNNPAPVLSKGAQRINAKLDEIILPEIHFDSVTLPAVVTWLGGNVKRHDPEKKGVEFLINNVMTDAISPNPTPSPVALVRDLKGNPIALPATEGLTPDLEIAFIKVTRPIKNLTLRQALDVICKTATVTMPDGRIAGLKYSIEDYAIVFSPKLPEKAATFSRVFKVDPETFVEGLRTVVFDEKELKAGGRAALEQALREKAWTKAPPDIKKVNVGGTNYPAVGGVSISNGVFSAVNTNLTGEINHLIRRYFIGAGVSNLGVTNGPDATQIFFNDRNGLLLVRASLEDLDIIQIAIELLNVKPRQVTIEARFAEMNQNDGKALGFELFGGTVITAPTTAPPDGVHRIWIDREGNYKLDGRARSLDQIESELKAVSRTNSGVAVRISAEHAARYDDATPVFERLSRIGITNSSYGVQQELSVLSARPSIAVNPTGVFPQPASAIAVPATAGGVTNKLVHTNSPALATLTGVLTAQQFAVVLTALEQRAAATLVSLPKVTTPSGKQAVVELPAAAKAAANFAQGLKLEVLPSVEADGYTIGFTVKVTRDGKQVFESRGVVWDAQTLMLGGLELPGAVARPGAKPPRLILFLTPTIVDDTGRRVHAPGDDMPFIPPAPAKK